MVQYGLNNVNSYDNLKGPMVKAHQGSQSHTGTEGCPYEHISGSAGTVGSEGAKEHIPGGGGSYPSSHKGMNNDMD